MQVVQPNEFVLVRNFQGQHYEEFCWKNEPNRLMEIMQRAENGTLGGHQPQTHGVRYGARCYFYSNRILVKLTKRNVKKIRIR